MLGLWLQEKCLNLYRRHDREKLLQEHHKEFERQEADIISLLKQTAFYHGTGAYHYTFKGGSKYDGGGRQVSYSLPNILKRGLEPQRDLFNDTFDTGATHSLSLTKNRIYARGYAFLFNYEKDRPYNYGPFLFWLWPIVLKIMISSLWFKLTKTRGERLESRKNYRIVSKYWTHSFRKDGKYEGSFLRCLFASSDIAGNFGFVIGVKHDVIEPLPINNVYKGVGIGETRTGQVIKPSDFSHLQVPLEYMETVKTEMRSAGLNIPVIPLEYVALHEHKTGFCKLVKLSKCKLKTQFA